MGDFNAPAASPGVRVLTDEAGFVDAFAFANPGVSGFTDGQDLTLTKATTKQRIDYVFLAPGRAVPGRVVGSRVVLDQPSASGRVRWPSDHYAVLAEVALDAPAASPVAGRGTASDVDHRLNAGR
jgi:endonuclease/exonuclease/phosphatase family metal-dependent hydrolase